MAKKQAAMVLNLIAWVTGVLVSLSIGFAMVGGTLTLPSWLGGSAVAMVVGWVVIVTTIVSAVMAVLQK
ncbi:TPA: hypothetical protein HA278_01620 [Candidatus Woesearchaeota archaeon]|nr:hypothetical protein [Candidatus Woesearchaeota archaeon]|tara:strand:- start:478 stop:684 length:207 start_codon:yes stop_codon:yes gene_type:complete